MEKDEDGLVGWLTRVGKWAGDLAKDMSETMDKTDPARAGMVPKPTNDAQVDSLRSLIRDMELQQVADTRLIAEQARTIERLQGELEHAREPMA
jgi:hypothetical protein